MFLLSSVRSIRTTSRRSPTVCRSAVTRASTSGRPARSASQAASTPRACTATVLQRPPWRTRAVPTAGSPSTSAPSTLAQQARNAAAQRGERNPRWSAPSIPSSSSRATSPGSIAKYAGSGPRGVAEVPDAQVRPGGPEHRGGEQQVVVLHDHAGAGCGLGGERVGEGAAVLAVAGPVLGEDRVEVRRPGRVEEQVVQEPQRRVGHRVVGPVERRRRDVEHPHRGAAGVVAGVVEAAPGGGADGLPVAAVQRGADPQRVRAGRSPLQRGDQAAAAAPGGERPVGPDPERHRSAVGRQQQPRGARRGRHGGRD